LTPSGTWKPAEVKLVPGIQLAVVATYNQPASFSATQLLTTIATNLLLAAAGLHPPIQPASSKIFLLLPIFHSPFFSLCHSWFGVAGAQ